MLLKTAVTGQSLILVVLRPGWENCRGTFKPVHERHQSASGTPSSALLDARPGAAAARGRPGRRDSVPLPHDLLEHAYGVGLNALGCCTGTGTGTGTGTDVGAWRRWMMRSRARRAMKPIPYMASSAELS
jgi:hypothetical protein